MVQDRIRHAAARVLAPVAAFVAVLSPLGQAGAVRAQSPIAEVICDSPDRMRERLERR